MKLKTDISQKKYIPRRFLALPHLNTYFGIRTLSHAIIFEGMFVKQILQYQTDSQ